MMGEQELLRMALVGRSNRAGRGGAAVAIGVLVALSGVALRVPGNGEFLAFAWLAGLAAAFICPGWPGFLGVLGGATVASAVIGSIGNGFWGPFVSVLVLLMVAPFVGHGALVGTLGRRLGALGWEAGRRDRRVVAGVVLAIAMAGPVCAAIYVLATP